MSRPHRRKSKGILTWPEGERPRERLLRLGPIGIKLLDHVIIGGEHTFSFADSGMMDEIALSRATA